ARPAEVLLDDRLVPAVELGQPVHVGGRDRWVLLEQLERVGPEREQAEHDDADDDERRDGLDRTPDRECHHCATAHSCAFHTIPPSGLLSMPIARLEYASVSGRWNIGSSAMS